MRAKEKTNIIKVGIFLSILIIILMIFVVSIGKENSLFDPKIEIRAVVKSASNLKPGAFVELKGIRVGEVDEVNIIEDDAVEILFKINSKSLRWIKANSKINISTAGLVGDKFLEIIGGSKEARELKPDKDVLFSDEAVDFKKFMNKGENIADTLGRVLARFESILAHIDDGKTITDTLVHIKEVSASIQTITREIEKAKLGETMKNFSQTTKRIDRITTRIEEGPGTFNSLIYDDGVHDDLRALLGGAERNKVLKYFIRESIKNNKTKP